MIAYNDKTVLILAIIKNVAQLGLKYCLEPSVGVGGGLKLT